jgi:carbonic anhydrase/acetyltransferase-like protein (isoleucine patch superfamily)
MDEQRRLPWDWIDLPIPDGVQIEEGAYVESAYSFRRYRSERSTGATFERGSSVYLGCMFDLGPDAEVRVGEFTLLNGVWFLSEELITIGHHTLISWDVVIMDSPQWSRDHQTRRLQTEQIVSDSYRTPPGAVADAQPVAIGSNVWIGFGSVIMPGVTIGDGAVIGCKSVVFDDVPPYKVAAGNPAKPIKTLGAGY